MSEAKLRLEERWRSRCHNETERIYATYDAIDELEAALAAEQAAHAETRARFKQATDQQIAFIVRDRNREIERKAGETICHQAEQIARLRGVVNGRIDSLQEQMRMHPDSESVRARYDESICIQDQFQNILLATQPDEPPSESDTPIRVDSETPRPWQALAKSWKARTDPSAATRDPESQS